MLNHLSVQDFRGTVVASGCGGFKDGTAASAAGSVLGTDLARGCYIAFVFTRKGLLALHHWTHLSLDRVFAHCAGLPAELFTRPVADFPHGDLRNELVHGVETEEYWVWKLRHPVAADAELPDWSAGDFPSVTVIDDRRRVVMAATRAYLEAITDPELNAPITLVWPERSVEIADRPVAFYLLHAITHAFHHKGQVAALCRLLGHPMGPTDLRFV
jgi:uncharacterized damage-inducible protein DinB